MAEYIERENAYKLISEQKEKETGMYSKGRNTVLNIAKSNIHSKKQSPTADEVEVVRCKDCKHRTNKGICEKFRQRYPFFPEDDFYCSYGELKEREKNGNRFT